ncbi:AraC family transcriptional regulator [Carboxylicivirga marina]|uniref:Helix-turn-helix transcriptional regulator n=1 Tax=Carboxylicivirga marina TaxID=2800988 RepID=A0ABS1HNY2_9BACT|nr:helix-turn-helix domain-containing protein [Carboxylicivirga marina]MBK3519396.1 helix-turn-helix transcriptional regulator [Carboxylicivirga marina]
MKVHNKVPDKGDPSDILQLFPKYNLQIHCCRYWWLQQWEFNELSFPYWRIYHNSYQGAVVIYEGREYALTPDKIVMIAPNTSYATRMHDHAIPDFGYTLKGGRVNASLSEKQLLTEQCILHLFIHFNLGMPYDNVSPGVFIFKLTEHLKEKLLIIKRHLNYEHARFSFYSGIAIQSLITDLIMELPQDSWELITNDSRILDVLSFIENNISNDLSNPALADKAMLATNAFTRLFTDEIGVPPQKYVKKKRIDKACVLLHHSNLSIDEVAVQSGFADRYHFSRIFKQITNVSPARYKKEYGMK